MGSFWRPAEPVELDEDDDEDDDELLGVTEEERLGVRNFYSFKNREQVKLNEKLLVPVGRLPGLLVTV